MDSSPSPIRILLVHDQQLIRAGLRLLLERESDFLVLAEATSGAEALTAAQLFPDIVVLDLKLGQESSFDLLRQLSDVSEHVRLLVLTDSLEVGPQQLAVRNGAMGVVVKTEAPAVLVDAIRKVHGGEVWLHLNIVATVLRDLLHPKEVPPAVTEKLRHQRLTEREREIIALVGEGLRNKEIAERLYISEATVRHSLTAIFEKVGVSNRSGLIVYSYQHGLAALPAEPKDLSAHLLAMENGKNGVVAH